MLIPVAGQDLFPTIDAGMMKLHIRAATGTRIEETERIIDNIERAIRKVIPREDLGDISDTIGLPQYFNLAFYQTDSIGPQDSDMLIQLKPGHRPTEGYTEKIRALLKHDFPDVEGYFQAADIVSQVLNFGLPGSDRRAGDRQRYQLGLRDGLEAPDQDASDSWTDRYSDCAAPRLSDAASQCRSFQGAATRSRPIGGRQRSFDIADSSFLLSPNFWLDPKNGVNYNVNVQVPQHIVDSVGELVNTPLTATSWTEPYVRRNSRQCRHR